MWETGWEGGTHVYVRKTIKETDTADGGSVPAAAP